MFAFERYLNPLMIYFEFQNCDYNSTFISTGFEKTTNHFRKDYLCFNNLILYRSPSLICCDVKFFRSQILASRGFLSFVEKFFNLKCF